MAAPPPPSSQGARAPRPLPAPPGRQQQAAAVASRSPQYPASYGPSSTIRPQPRINAHEALYGLAGGGAQPESDWLASPQGAGAGGWGETYFVPVGSGTQRLGGGTSSRPSLGGMLGGDARSPPQTSPRVGGAQQPQFNERTSYSPPSVPQQLPPGARPPLPSPPVANSPTTPASPNSQQGYGQPSSPPLRSRSKAPQTTTTTKVPLPTSSSILLHDGFWQLLSATGSRFLAAAPSPPAVVAPTFPPGFGSEPPSPLLYQQQQQERRTQTAPAAPAQGARAQEALKKKKRVSVDMVGRPKGFQHLVHASDHEQAEELLRRWHQDGVGKLGRPNWAAPIKEAARARVRARGIAEVQAHRDDEATSPVLQVTNGMSAISSSTVGAVEDEAQSGALQGVPEEQMPGGWAEEGEQLEPPSFPGIKRTNTAETTLERTIPAALTPGAGAGTMGRSGGNFAFAEGGTTRFTPQAWDRPALPGASPSSSPNPQTLSFDRPGMFNPLPTSVESPPPASPSSDRTITATDGHGALSSDNDSPFGLPHNFVPSLTTIEKAVSTKIFFETKYHEILRKPRSRDQRKALLEAELSRLQMTDQQRNTVRAAWALSETEYLREVRSKVGVGSFVKLKTIGHGAFGVVSLVKERGTGELYAMKQLRKADMLRKGQEGHVRAERDLLATASTSTRWTVRLAYSFQDVDHLYLVMTFMSGGDLLTLLIDRDTFPEEMARFYIAEMVLAISETHRVLGAIHRDIKPDNFLFDSRGHIAISDFGLATDFHWAHDGAYFDQQRRELLYKHGIDLEGEGGRRAPATPRFDEERLLNGALEGEDKPGSVLTWRDKNRRRLAYSVVGTNNYMAADVLRGYGYDQSCDWWSLGVIMYEMLFGYPPFVSKSRQLTRQKIMTWKTSLRFPAKPRISREAQDLISSLICEREDRLGSRGTTAGASRPNSIVMNQRRSGFLAGTPAAPTSGVQADGVEEIMAHPWFKGIDFATIHLQTPPFVPDLASKDDTRYFEDDIDANPLPPPEIAPGVPAPDSTRDPMLRNAEQGAALLEVRKGLAFQGWTYKKPRRQVYDPRRGLDMSSSSKGAIPEEGEYRGPMPFRSDDGAGSSLKRSLSI